MHQSINQVCTGIANNDKKNTVLQLTQTLHLRRTVRQTVVCLPGQSAQQSLTKKQNYMKNDLKQRPLRTSIGCPFKGGLYPLVGARLMCVCLWELLIVATRGSTIFWRVCVYDNKNSVFNLLRPNLHVHYLVTIHKHVKAEDKTVFQKNFLIFIQNLECFGDSCCAWWWYFCWD